MTKTELVEIITNGENSGVEFKRDDVRPEQLAKEMAALLNLEGGHILLCVEEDGTVVGLSRDPEKAEEWVMEYERAQGYGVYDVYEKNLGYDITSLELNSGELRFIEVKGLAGQTGMILLTPNERRVAEDRRDCYWLYIVTNCAAELQLQEPIRDPARFPWHEVTKVAHYYLSVDALTQPVRVREKPKGYGDGGGD